MKPVKKMKLFASVLMLTCLACPTAWADSEKTTKLDDVVVTSTRTKQTVMESPTSISVISAKDLENMDAKNFAEAVKKLPGVYYTNASGLEPKLSLRGTHIGMSPGALVLVNGIPMSMGEYGYTDYDSIPVENIKKIEVVKGPISSLYGGNSARGVINIITKKSHKAFSGKVKLAGGSYGDKRGTASISGAKDKLDYSVSVKRTDQESHRHHTWLKNNYATGELGYYISDETRIGAYINLTDKERSLDKKLTFAQRNQDPRQTSDYSLTENKDAITGIQIETAKKNWELTSNIYYKYRDKDYRNYLLATSTPYKKSQKENILGTRNIFTLKQPLGDRANKFSFGFDYDHDDLDLLTIKAASKNPSLPYTKKDDKKSGQFESDKLGLFVQDEFSLLSNLTLTAGLRFDYFRFDNQADYDFSAGGTKAYDSEPSYDKLNPRLALNYRPLKDLSFYGSYSQSYRAPSIYDYYASGTSSAQNAYVLKPESFTQFELGTRYRFSEKLGVEATVFQLVIEDMLDSAYIGGTYMGKQNIGETTFKGFELTLSGNLHPRVSYSLNYAYTDARYSGDIWIKSGENIKDRRVTKIPYHQVNLDLGIDLLRLDAGNLAWHINAMAQDDYAMDNANTSYYQGYGLVNTMLKWDAKRYTVFFNVDNVLDKDYDGYAYASSGKQYYYPAAGTTFSAGVEVSF